MLKTLSGSVSSCVFLVALNRQGMQSLNGNVYMNVATVQHWLYIGYIVPLFLHKRRKAQTEIRHDAAFG